MKRILITGAGGSPATNFVRSLRVAPEPFYLIGVDCNKYYVQRAETDERHLVPTADDPQYVTILKEIITESGAEFIYAQPDQEVFRVSECRHTIGVRTFLPAHETICICHDKFRSYKCWRAAGLRVPETRLIMDEGDLVRMFSEFGAPLWLRATYSPGAGRGSFRADSLEAAKIWLKFCEGMGKFTIAEYLTPNSATWMSIWHEGELIVGQGRKRLYWELGSRAPSGVTGITGTGVTIADPQVDDIAQKAILAVDSRPHGIFAVDMTYDREGIPNPTEINIGRFFTTHYFFTAAGLNMPYFLIKLAFGEPVPHIPKRCNPLTPGLAWIRGMDFLPVLTDLRIVDMIERELAERRTRHAD